MHALVFGSSGALGSVITGRLQRDGFSVSALSHREALDQCPGLPTLDAVVWAQGLNASDSLLAFDEAEFGAVMEANVAFIARTTAELLRLGKLAKPARLVLVSSIWQEMARTQKFSYTVSKAAVAGLVRSAAADLGACGVLVNAVLPGVVDTPMARANLSAEQIASITSASPLGRLPTALDIASAVAFLVGTENQAITGQCLTVDAGFSTVRQL
jgi:NAD(P)-dependent dehydrogenase (short-subunit alcohol dehydrogenase family)